MTLNVIVVVYLMVVCNAGFWAAMTAAPSGETLDLVIFGGALCALTLFTFAVVSLPWIHRPVLAVLILVASAASFYQSRFGILIDRDMIQNIMRTTGAESRQLITTDYLIHLALTGILPAAMVFYPRINYPPLRHLIWRWPAGIVATLGLTLALIYSDYATIASTVREHRNIMGSYQPGASIGAAPAMPVWNCGPAIGWCSPSAPMPEKVLRWRQRKSPFCLWSLRERRPAHKTLA